MVSVSFGRAGNDPSPKKKTEKHRDVSAKALVHWPWPDPSRLRIGGHGRRIIQEAEGSSPNFFFL
jgi:hypothetical protein